MPLGEHLRADQDARLAAVHALEHGSAWRPVRRGRVPVQARERRVREQPRQGLLDALGALAHRVERLPRSCRRRRAPAACAPQWWQRSSRRAPVQRSCAHRSARTAPPSRRHCRTASARSRAGSGTRSPARRRTDAGRWPASRAATSPARRRVVRRSTSAMRGASARRRRAAAARAAYSAPAPHSPASRARASPSPARSAPARAARASTARSRAE